MFLILALVANIGQVCANDLSQQTSINITQIEYVLEDKVVYDLQRILSFDKSRWQLAERYPLNLGNLQQGAWIRFDLNNVENALASRIIEFSNPDLHKLSIFKQASDGQLTHWELGSYLPFVDRPILSRNFAVPIQLKAKERVRFYVRAESNVGVLIPISVREESEFWYLANFDNLTLGLYFGILIMFIAFNAGMFLARNDYVFLLLSVDLLIFALMYANHLGLNFEYLWPVDPQFNYLAGLFLSYLVVLSANVFTWHFLKMEQSRIQLTFYYGFNALALLGFIILWFIPVSISSFICAVLGMGVALYLLSLTFIKWRSGAEFSFYYFVSYAFAALATLIYVAHKLALLPTNFFTSYAIGHSILLQAIVLTCVLIERKKVVEKIIGFEAGAKVIPNSTRDWIAQFSHEIRTPLNGVIGMAELLKQTPLNPTQYNYVRVLASSGEYLTELVDGVLDYESLSNGGVALDEASFDLKLLCEEAVKMFQQQASENKVLLELQFDSGLSTHVVADSKRLKQVLINLLNNAIKFTHDGCVQVVVKESSEGCLSLSVSDDGIGMTKQQQEGIFERFRQADQSIYAKYGGSGLGLAICRQLVELMDGEIYVRSKLGEFTCFTIELPLKLFAGEEEVVERGVGRAINAVTQGGEVAPEVMQVERQAFSVDVELVVLGVDDNEINRRVLSAMLRKLGHRMIEAYSGQEALDIVKSGAQIDLILMDCEMPIMNGFEATMAIRKWQYGQAGKPCSIIALTAHVLDEHKERCTDAGMDGHLCKPLHLSELRDLLLSMEG